MRRRQFLQRAITMAGALVGYSILGASPAHAAWWWGSKFCTSISMDTCESGIYNCVKKWGQVGTGGDVGCTSIVYSPNNVYYAQCHCQVDPPLSCQAAVCVCSEGYCACEEWVGY